MMSELFDEVYLRQQYYKAETKRIAEEAEAKGEAKKAKAIAQKLREMGFSEEQIKEFTTI